MQIICHTDFKHRGYTFEILIIENTDGKYDVYEAWIRVKDYGVMEYMFGCDKEQTKLDEFQNIVEFNAYSYADSYLDEYVEESEDE